MNVDTYEALQAAGLSDDQAKVIATAIPDLESMRKDMGHRFDAVDYRFDTMDHRFEALEARLDTKFSKLTNTAIYSAVGLGGAIIAAAGILRSLFP